MFRLHAKRRGCGAKHVPRGAPETRNELGQGGHGGAPHRSRATARPLAHAERPNTGWGGIVRHRAPAASRHPKRQAKRVAWRAPPHGVPLQSNPPTPGKTARGKADARKHAVDMDTSCPAEAPRGGRGPRGNAVRLRPTQSRLHHPLRGRQGRDASGAVPVVLHATSRVRAEARNEGRRETRLASSRAEHRPVKGHAPHRRGPSPTGRP